MVATRRATINMVADIACVSRQTVSNVINAPHLVRDETRQRVVDAIATLGYQPNEAARTLRVGRSRLLAVLIDKTDHDADRIESSQFLEGLVQAAERSSFHFMMHGATELNTYKDLQTSYRPAGFVLSSTRHWKVRTEWLVESDVPFVAFGRPPDGLRHSHWVDFDDSAGVAEITRHLFLAGHRRIAFVDRADDATNGESARRTGWAQSMLEGGEELVGLERRVTNGIAHGERAAADLLGTPRPPTAIVCGSDSLAAGALRACAAAAPATVVTGYGNTPLAAALGFTSVDRRIAHAATHCVDILTGLIEGEDRMPVRQVMLKPRIVLRAGA
ncbi:LacI family DNA-binding transcriptional regulator [Micromonospora sp. NPDC050686]|uniref:LacI family DNA-binding transcriptional regulator n=1 Tax=Micromonospora sp. NPDC050686 TaxID=3154631 RepID=UPI003406B1B1